MSHGSPDGPDWGARDPGTWDMGGWSQSTPSFQGSGPFSEEPGVRYPTPAQVPAQGALGSNGGPRAEIRRHGLSFLVNAPSHRVCG